MKLKTRDTIKNNDDNLLPLVNIIFLLLIFFMLAGVIAKQKDLHNIDLASATIEKYTAVAIENVVDWVSSDINAGMHRTTHETIAILAKIVESV